MCVQNTGTNFGWVRALGYLLMVTSILTISLTIADILATYFLCPPGAPTDPDCRGDDVWTWIASGIWTSVFVFVLGLWTVAWSYTMDRPGVCQGWFTGFVYFLLVPIMICLTSVEAYKYKDNRFWSGDRFDKLPIPITLTCLGFVEFLACFFLYNEIFCRKWTDDEYVEETATATASATEATTSFQNSNGANPLPSGTSPAQVYSNQVYPNFPCAARVRTVFPTYGIYSAKTTNAVQPQAMGWNTPAFLYWPQNRVRVQ